jgi:hypothetical protein
MTKITRTIPVSLIYASIVTFEKDQIKETPLTAVEVFGVKVDIEKAMKHVIAKYGKGKAYVIRSIETQENVYEISLDEFIRHSKLILPDEKPQDEPKDKPQDEPKDKPQPVQA